MANIVHCSKFLEYVLISLLQILKLIMGNIRILCIAFLKIVDGVPLILLLLLLLLLFLVGIYSIQSSTDTTRNEVAGKRSTKIYKK